MPSARSTRDRDIVRLAIPALGALAAEPTYVLIDTAIVGHIGTVQLAALGLAATFLASIFWIFNFLSNGTASQIARLHGAERPEEIGAVAAQSVWVALGIGLTLLVVGVVATPLFISILQAHGAVAHNATTYLRISFLGAPFVMLALAGQGWARGVHRMTVPLKILVASNLLNVALEVLFIYGFGWGIAGSAWGTVIAQACAGAAFAYVLSGAIGGHWRFVRAKARALMAIGGPLMVRTGALLLCFNVINALLASKGEVGLAANQVLLQMMLFIALIMDSLAIAGQALVGSRLGAADVADARAYANRVTVLSFGAGLVVAALLAAGVNVIPEIFTPDQLVIDEVTNVWPLFVFYNIYSAVVFGWDGVLLGAGDARFLMATMLSGAVVCLPLGAVLIEHGHGVYGAWIAFAALNAVRFIGNGSRILSGRWAIPGAARA